MAYKGKFKPKNRTKYKGDPDKIIYRSLWELRFMRYLDSTPSILKWSSEEVVVPYRSPIDGRRHRYFPDFWIRVKTSDGSVKESLIEIKPKAQCSPPKGPPKDNRKKKIHTRSPKLGESMREKMEGRCCKDRNWKFQILTEDNLTKY